MIFRKIILALAISSTLAGCASMQGALPGVLTVITASVPNPINQQDLAAIQASYVTVQVVADKYVQRYRDGYRCTKTSLESITNLCSRRSVVLRIQKADRAAQIALVNAGNFIAANPTLEATDVLAAARSAVATFMAIKQEMI